VESVKSVVPSVLKQNRTSLRNLTLLNPSLDRNKGFFYNSYIPHHKMTMKGCTMSFVEDLFGLTGRTAAVIGGGGVLAGAMTEGLARAGADVAVLDLHLENTQKRVEKIKALGVRSLGFQVDVSKKADIQNACDQIIRQWGKVDILINAAGVNSGTPFFEITEEEWEKIIQVNLKGIFLACQVFGKHMVEQKSGSIINISSASSGPPLSRVFTYAVSKAGLNNLTQNLAREWATSGVRVNAIAPGFFPAEQNKKLLTRERIESIFRHTPMNRFGKAEELVPAVIWLASEKASSFVTGAIIWIDGGFHAMTI
jgi:NAD(P)-dependent dehydrogenase (short-subunit alcohol dehydrogenase family)